MTNRLKVTSCMFFYRHLQSLFHKKNGWKWDGKITGKIKLYSGHGKYEGFIIFKASRPISDRISL